MLGNHRRKRKPETSEELEFAASKVPYKTVKVVLKSNSKMIKCTHCTKTFKYESERRRHELSHFSPKYECSECGKKFIYKSVLIRHEGIHNRNDDIVHCEKCPKTFRDRQQLLRHMRYSHEGIFKCSQCGVIFNSEKALKYHTYSHKPREERRYRCSFNGCTKAFSFGHHLKHHEMTHTNTKQYFCNVCGKGFIQKVHLTEHIKSHEPNTWLMCTEPDCNKTFYNEYARNKHLKRHKIKESKNKNCSTLETRKEIEDDKLFSINLEYNGEDVSTAVLYYQRKYNAENVKSPFDRTHPNKDKENEYIDKNNVMNTNKERIISSFNLELISDDEYYSVSNCKNAIGHCVASSGAGQDVSCLCKQIHDLRIVKKRETEGKQYPPHKTNNLTIVLDNLESRYEYVLNNELTVPGIDNRQGNFTTYASDTSRMVDESSFKYTAPVINSVRNCTTPLDDMPQIFINSDGTVKLKEKDNDDFVINSKCSERKGLESIDFRHNSCTAVLGNCIATENGKVGEGCLCAKMTIEDPINVQEIDEITPLNLVSTFDKTLIYDS